MTVAQKCSALLLQRCPRCGQGSIYATSTQMRPRCPVCDLLFEREPGYFLGSLYISYGLATLVMLLMLAIGHLLLPRWDLGSVVLLVGLAFLPLASLVTRYARVIWIFFDRWAWPTRAGRSD